MSNLIIVALVVLAVISSLFIGVFFMTRDGEDNRKKSNKMMRFRIVFQALAILIIVLVTVFHRL